MNRRWSVCIAVWTLMTALATCGCARALEPTALPDVSGMARPVAAQLRAQEEQLARSRANPSTSSEDLAGAYGTVCKLLLATEIFSAARPYCENAHTLAPADARWSYFLAHIYRAEGESAKAAGLFEQVLARRPDDLPALVWLGRTYLDQGRPDLAGPLFARVVAAHPNMGAAHLELGRVALDQRDYPRAIEHLQRALALDPRASAARYPLAMAYRATGNTEQAAAHLRLRGGGEATLPDPLMQDIADSIRSPVVYETRGDRAITSGNFTAAVSEFRRGLDLAPENVPLRQKLGMALSLAGDLPGAIEQFQDVLRRSPDFAPVHYSLGVLLLGSGQLEAAIDRFSAAVRFDPSYLQARLQLGNALRRARRYEPASLQYDRIIQMDPRIGEARFGQAVTSMGLKRYADARDRLVEGVRLFPDRLEFMSALARLYAAAPDANVRDGARARTLAADLVKRRMDADAQETMAMALAEAREFDAAARWQREAIASVERAGRHELAQQMADNLRLYQQQRPCRVPWRDDPAWDPL